MLWRRASRAPSTFSLSPLTLSADELADTDRLAETKATCPVILLFVFDRKEAQRSSAAARDGW